MSVATSTAIGLGLAAAGTVGSIVSANKQSHAATAAAQMQQDASNKAGDRSTAAMQQALGLIGQNQLAMQQSYAPRIQMGNNALSRIGQGLGLPAVQQQPPQMNALSSSQPSKSPDVSRGYTDGPQPSMQSLGPGLPSGAPGAAPTTGGMPGGMPSAAGQANAGLGQPNSAMPNTAQANQAQVTLEAPGTGERWTGPLDQAQQWIAKGARRVA